MKTVFKPLLIIALCAFPLMITAQVTIGSGSAPASYCLLELDTRNTKGGLRLPQLKGEAIDNFKTSVEASVAAATMEGKEYVEGLIFYNLDIDCIEFWSETGWQTLCGDSAMLKIMQDSLLLLNQRVEVLEERIHTLENFTQLSDVTDYTAQSNFPGLGVSVIYSGYNYNFWGTGAISSTGSRSYNNNSTYYLIRGGATDNPAAGICRALTLYQGDPTIGTLWIDNKAPSGSTVLSMPVYFDNTGIYIKTTSSLTIYPQSTFRFTQSLILVDND